jgi:cytochrome c oxidase assembly protein subunit 15
MASAPQKVIAIWLYAVAAMVFAMIVLGGVTRLTQSGLSMTEWMPVTGWLPPLDEAAWMKMFAAYQSSPEYRKLNLGMTLGDYKMIFWLEYVHRLWGRMIGVAFLMPLLVFIARGWVGRPLAIRLFLLFVLGGLQGALGWYMVMSGLVDEPRVSQYRLAAHLGLGVIIFAAILWTALDLWIPATSGKAPTPMRKLRRCALSLVFLIFVTQLSGAFVAGLHAGLTYNTFPLMDGQWVPEGAFALKPLYLNFFENVATVQFDHRLLATLVVAATAWFWWRARREALTANQRRTINLLAAAAALQASIGIATLLLVVPVPLAALHQGVAVALLAAALWTAHVLGRQG